MGWTGDTQVFSETACILSDPYAFYRKYLYDCEQEQLHNEGNVPNIVPMVANKGRGSAVWGDATTIIPWNMYLYSGDSSILEEHYPSMCAWVDYMTKIDGDNHGWLQGQPPWGTGLLWIAPMKERGRPEAVRTRALSEQFITGRVL